MVPASYCGPLSTVTFAIHGLDDCNARCAHVGPVGGAGAKKCDVAAYEIVERAENSEYPNTAPLPPIRTALIGPAPPDVNCDGRISRQTVDTKWNGLYTSDLNDYDEELDANEHWSCVTMIIRRCLALLVLFLMGASSTAAQKTVDFQRDVRPILTDNCFQCHGPDEGSRWAGLRLDTQDGAFGERPDGQTIVPGEPEKSLLYQRIAHEDEAYRMPPMDLSNKTLSPEQIEVLRRWIEEGASWDQHWSFEPVERVDPPAVTNEPWVHNPIDRFVLARLEAEGLAPAPEADKRTLARRVALDLTGLPPDPGTLASFLSDTSEGAYETLASSSPQDTGVNIAPATGSMPPAMEIPTAYTSITIARCIFIAIG